MSRSNFDLAAEFERLKGLGLIELREAWRRLHQTPPPARLSREILLRGLTYKLQEGAFGGLARLNLRRLQPGSVEASRPRVSLKPGTQLVREWHGVIHTVLILDDGVEWRGPRYQAPSVVAPGGTAGHWAGPRLFGPRAGGSDG